MTLAITTASPTLSDTSELPACSGEQGVYQHAGVFALHFGGSLQTPRLAWQLLGPKFAPVVVVLGGISANRHVCASQDDPSPGWWSDQVGVGRAVDTNKFRVLSFDWLGGNGNSSGPQRGVKDALYPTIAPTDQVEALILLLDYLNIDRVAAIVGASYGGMVGLRFGERYPNRVGRLFVIGAAHEPHPQATALRWIQREAVQLGQRTESPQSGLRLARALGMVSYRTPREFKQRFGPLPEAQALNAPLVTKYLDSHGQTFAKNWNAEAYLRLSNSIDIHRVNPESIDVATTLVAVRSDHLVPCEQVYALADRLPKLNSLIEFDSLYGHDAFLKEVIRVAAALRSFLQGI